jgi:hypothetical protein
LKTYGKESPQLKSIIFDEAYFDPELHPTGIKQAEEGQ